MSNDLKVSGPIEVKDNSAERVAYDLMSLIANNENSRTATCAAKEASKRLYYLTLYKECLSAVKYGTVPQSDSSLG